jgi:GST-like protein
MKVALFMEEAGLEYQAVPVDTRAGDQHVASFKAINPNAKVPAIVDGDVTLFDSNAILLYLAEKEGRFLGPKSPGDRGELLSWLMFVASGIGPYSGQAVHFQHHAPEKLLYAINRYRFEAQRHYDILDARLGDRPYMLGDDYSIVDMAVWGWARLVPFILGEEEAGAMVNLKRLVDEISARPAAGRAIAIKDRHAFKAEMDEEARRNMFPSNY